MSPRKPRNVIAVTPGGDLTMDHIMGWYAVSSIPDAGVSSTKLRREWIANGLNPDLIPKNRKAVHAFQVACRSVETRRRTTSENGNGTRSTEIKVDEVLENQDECIYQVTRMVRDKENKDIEFTKTIQVIFTKATEEITDRALDKGEYEALKHLTEAIRDHFDSNAKKVPGAKVRAAIRDEMQDVRATTIAKKMYFIPKGPGREVVESLTTVIEMMYGDEGEFHAIPVASDEGQKAIVAKHFGINVRERAQHLLAEVAERVRAESGVRSDRLKNMLNDRKQIIAEVEKYKDLLDMSLTEVDEQVDMLNEGLEELIVQTGQAGVTAD